MKTSNKIKKFYFDLGRKTYNQLPKVGRASKEYRDWQVFSSSEGFKSFILKHKMTPEDIEEFRKGFCSKS